MQQRFRRGVISIGPTKCDGCGGMMQHGEIYLAIDEKQSDKLKEETIFLDEVDCTECGNKIENGDEYLLILEGDSEKCYCPACYKKKGSESFREKSCGALIIFNKSRQISENLHFCSECCRKRKTVMEKKEKGDKIFTFFPSRTGR